MTVREEGTASFTSLVRRGKSSGEPLMEQISISMTKSHRVASSIWSVREEIYIYLHIYLQTRSMRPIRSGRAPFALIYLHLVKGDLSSLQLLDSPAAHHLTRSQTQQAR